MSEADEIELAYIHVPTFYNAKLKTENKTNTNTVQSTREFTEEENTFGYVGVVLIIMVIWILLLNFLQKRSEL